MARDHEFDIVIWGATGSTGRRVAHHMAARNDEGDLRWAIAGRNQAKLEALRSLVGSGAADIPIVTADSHDVASLEALVARTKVVCSVVGPYAIFGSELLAACVRSGTDYCDLAAEAHWIRKMIDAHQAEAEGTGARIVHACGMDSIPSDLGVFLLQRAAKERYGKPCPDIRMRVKFSGGGFSGGTAGCLIYGMETRDDSAIMAAMKDPYSLNPEGQRQGPEGPDKAMSVKVIYDEDLEAWTKPFFMGPMNTKIVRRSNALMGYPYGEDFHYEEAMLVGPGPGGWLKAKTQALRFGGLIASAAIPPTRWLLKKFVLPKPGEGPSREIREGSDWEVVLIGTMQDGNVVCARFKGEGDPGTESTSRMITESALCLAQDSDKITVGGGSWTPSSAMGELLLPRLTAYAGLSFEFEVPEKRPKGALASA
jgi:short subunit dehydrogenase-like uncharacterized protein